jgi:phosphoglucomutase
MPQAGIHFGKGDWRGVVGEDFTFAKVRLAAAAMARLVRKGQAAPRLLVAHDTRFLSEDFARAAAAVLERGGVHAVLADRPTPTAAVSFAIPRGKFAGGLVLTGGDVSSEYNGVKLLDRQGMPLGPAQVAEIERLAGRLADEGWEAQGDEIPELETTDLSIAYLDRLSELVRFDAMRRNRLSVTYDAMHGSGAGWLDWLLAAKGIPVETLHAERDVLFEGQSPDPLPAQLHRLAHVVRRSGASLGMATDGAGGRFGILDGEGRFLTPNHLLGLLCDYLAESRGWRLGVARSVATSHLIDAVARLHGLPVHRTPVGFDGISRLVAEGRVDLGGDEGAGLAIGGHVPEKDGILACLLVAEMVAERGPVEGQLVALFRCVGAEFWPVRLDVALDEAGRARLATWLKSEPEEFLGRRVVHTDHTDGLELEFEGGSWLLVRPSGTEPLSRIYAEAGSLDQANRLGKETGQWIRNLK